MDVNVQDQEGKSAFHYSVERGHEAAIVIKILEVPNVDVNIQDEDGWSILHYSAENGP